ncbi:hypothetical protein A6V29_19620 [Blastococcus sp. CCUG 61487]|nr:hypothetical protein A6V29_19620 [Blastococcus sp. CCUG 61487]
MAGAFADFFAGAFFAGAAASLTSTAAVALGAREPAATDLERFGVLAADASGAGWSAGTQVPSLRGTYARRPSDLRVAAPALVLAVREDP